ncbi:MAG: DUF1146 domain-containing protein [Erysipelotrichaceae bacterium]|nr:DUF1146 domain-containing protein [Erysipelotrichaceae bacterium]MBQ5756338.1 DUF1146 domain-containing protein [Erysipelotrichaceae bacterium]
MNRFVMRLIVYFIAFALSLFGLSALDFSRFLKRKADPLRAQLLYILLAMCMAYLIGQFFMAVMYSFYDPLNPLI